MWVLMASMRSVGCGRLGVAEREMAAFANPERLRRILSKMLDENEFLDACGIRSLAMLIQLFGSLDERQLLESGKTAAFAPGGPACQAQG